MSFAPHFLSKYLMLGLMAGLLLASCSGRSSSTGSAPPVEGESLTEEQQARGQLAGITGTQGDDVHVLNGGAVRGNVRQLAGNDVLELRGTSFITGTLNGGDGIDRLIWLRDSSEGTSSLNIGRVINYEHLTLAPRGLARLTISTGTLLSMINISTANEIHLGAGVTVHNSSPDGLNLGAGNDRLTLAGTTAGLRVSGGPGTDTLEWLRLALPTGIRQPDFGLLTNFENLLLTPSGGTTLSLTAAQAVGMLNIIADNEITVAAGVSLTGALDAGRGNDTFTWMGGSVGEDEDSLDPTLLTNFEHLKLTPQGGETASLTGAQLAAILTVSADNSVEIGRGVALSGAFDAGGGSDTFIWSGGTVGETENAFDPAMLSNLEHLHLLPAGGQSLMLTGTGSGEQLAAMLDLNEENTLRLGANVLISGAVDLSEESDTLELLGGVINGNVSTGTSDDTVILRSGQITGTLSGGGGEDSLTVIDATIGEVPGSITGISGFEHLTLTPLVGSLVVSDAVLLAALETAEANRVTLGSGVTISGSTTLDLAAGADRLSINGATVRPDILLGAGNDIITLAGGIISGTIDGGDDSDTLIWNGGTLGGSLNTLDMSRISQFENLTLTPGDSGGILSVTGSGSGEDLAGALNFDVANTLIIGTGVTISSAVNFGDGTDRFSWLGGTVGAMAGELDPAMLTGLESLTLTPAAGQTLSLTGTGSGEQLAAMLDFTVGNALTIGTGITLSSAVDFGDGEDHFIWRGGTVGATANELNPAMLRNLEHLTLTPASDQTLSLTGTGSGQQLAAMLNLNVANRLVLGSGITVTSDIDTGDGNDRVEIAGGNISADISGGAGNDTFTLRFGSVSGDINGGAGDDIFRISGGAVSGTLDGGEDDDTLILGGHITMDDLTIDNIEETRAESGLALAATDFKFGRLVLQSGPKPIQISLAPGGIMEGKEILYELNGRSASRLSLDGDMADDIFVRIRRNYDPSASDLSIANALSVSGRMGNLATDNTAGLACNAGQCDLLLYDRAVPTALGTAQILSALSQPLTGELLKPVEHNHTQTTQLRQSLTGEGRVGWHLNSFGRMQGKLSGAQTVWARKLGKVSLRLSGQAMHLDLAARIGAPALTNRLKGVGSSIAALWQADPATSLFLVADTRLFDSNSLQMFGQPLGGRLDASTRQLTLGATRTLLDKRAHLVQLRSRLTWDDSKLQLNGVDRVNVAVDSDSALHSRFGISGRQAAGKLDWQWSADYVRQDKSLIARVLNTASADVIHWNTPHKAMEWQLALRSKLGGSGSVSLKALRRDAVDGSGFEPNYGISLSFGKQF